MRQTISAACLAIALSGVAARSVAAEYVVQPGDTLIKIARNELGDESQWREIARLNGLGEPYSLQIGQRLELPSPPEGGRNSVPLWSWAIIAIAICWLVESLCLRAGCWFALVDTTVLRCAVLALVLSLAWSLCVAVVIGMGVAAARDVVPWPAAPVTAGLLAIAYPIAAAIAMKQTFGCKWRSVATIWVMAIVVGGFLSWTLALAVSAGLPNVMKLDAVKEFLLSLVTGG